MNCLIIVNESPWGSGLALGAWRFAQAARDKDLRVDAVFFREEGVYHALAAESSEAGSPDLCAAWAGYARETGCRLLLCRSSAGRRLPKAPESPFESSGLTEMFDLMLSCDRVISY